MKKEETTTAFTLVSGGMLLVRAREVRTVIPGKTEDSFTITLVDRTAYSCMGTAAEAQAEQPLFPRPPVRPPALPTAFTGKAIS
jgi:hypothetical protein